MKNKCHISRRELSQLQHIKIWAQLDQRFVRYKKKLDLTFDLHLHNQDGLIMNLMFYVIWLSGHYSICTRNLGNLWWMVMKIWMIMWKHKMAPRWRHGWVIRLKRLLYPFLIRAKILWKFENDCSFRFGDILNTKFIQRGGKKICKDVMYVL